MGKRRMKMRKSKLVVLGLIAALALTGCGSKAKEEPKTSPDTDATATAIPSGTFTGEGEGKGGKIKVELTLENGEIKKIDVLENNETQGFADAMQTITDAMIGTNSFDVDSVSGATLTSTGFKTAVENAFEKTGASKDQLVAKEAAGTSNKEEREAAYTADVVIVGAGGAGLTAAIEAANNGASVILLEKMPMEGGNTLISGGEYAAPGNWLQKEEGIEDSKDQFYEDILKGGDYENDPELVRVLADHALESAEWLKDEVNVTFEDYMLFFGGHSVKRSLVPKDASGVELISKLTKKAGEVGVITHLNTTAKELVVENDKVVAVKAEFDGKEITYSANKGVILATGGFGSNLEMRVKYNPEMNEKILSTNSVGSTGDGITMAENVGAELVDMQYIQTYPTCDPELGTLLYVGDVRMEGRSILVNKEGKRFVEELERRDVISRAVVAQTGGVSYMFWDEASMVASGVNVKHQREYDYLIEKGILIKADTIEEAAAFFDIDAEELKKTVEKYNEYAKNGKDEEFNKRGTLTAFTGGPYYIMKSKPAIHHTMGGIKINTDANVINTDGNIIKGLFAAGEVTGDIHGTNRLGSDAIADITVFGRIAGRNAAKAE
ncbi:flavocytochrome c [Lachnoclostridium phytofermentans ISDg]|uniref:Urocanate reductase n=2 Tax=Lachnoclostridium phytofermentans TaxID=66219 RepID=A9KL83_LACP7|nr:flavocytochrome c [Lachnoclostridium phytofermentans ISDg]